MMMKKYEITIKSENLDFRTEPIRSFHQAQQFARKFYYEDINIYESVFIILLNRNNDAIGYAKIAQGGVAGSFVDGKIVCKYAIDTLASGVILVHNHPSGNTSPSESDRMMTDTIRKQLALFDIKLLDHIILTKDKYYSFTENQ